MCKWYNFVGVLEICILNAYTDYHQEQLKMFEKQF